MNNKNNFKRNQQGLSLIELMISMVVGLFLLVGLVSSFISTKDSDRNRNAISEMDGNASVIFDVMRKTITHAGYVTIDPVVRPTPGFYGENHPALQSATCKNGSQRESAALRAAIQPTADIPNRDTITIISLADNPCIDGKLSCPNDADLNPQALVYYDCTGEGMTRNADAVACSADKDVGMFDRIEAKIYNSFRLELNAIDDEPERTLFCDGSRGGTQPIANNVEAIQYLYGIKEGEDTETLADDTVTFKNADKVRDDDDWEKVRSVQVALLMRSSNQNLLKENSSKTFYSLLDTKVDIDPADRKRLFRVYTTTINLENMN